MIGTTFGVLFLLAATVLGVLGWFAEAMSDAPGESIGLGWWIVVVGLFVLGVLAFFVER